MLARGCTERGCGLRRHFHVFPSRDEVASRSSWTRWTPFRRLVPDLLGPCHDNHGLPCLWVPSAVRCSHSKKSVIYEVHPSPAQHASPFHLILTWTPKRRTPLTIGASRHQPSTPTPHPHILPSFNSSYESECDVDKGVARDRLSPLISIADAAHSHHRHRTGAYPNGWVHEWFTSDSSLL